jgi:hypothetical protein
MGSQCPTLNHKECIKTRGTPLGLCLSPPPSGEEIREEISWIGDAALRRKDLGEIHRLI